MCRMISTVCLYTKCEHQTDLRRQKIECRSLNCTRSTSHRQDSHDCRNDCVHTMGPEIRLIDHTAHGACDTCTSLAQSQSLGVE
ncbi:hypothetical protein CC2G_011492 [Coprinopsis cinerea AmutBmut pab1-1]|nr:hypothetical protein CC2G_011492 [Coprinopsis cinerea AmutBmut pab1-1]